MDNNSPSFTGVHVYLAMASDFLFLVFCLRCWSLHLAPAGQDPVAANIWQTNVWLFVHWNYTFHIGQYVFSSF